MPYISKVLGKIMLVWVLLPIVGLHSHAQTVAATDSIIEEYKNKAWEWRYSDEAAANRVLHLGMRRSKKLNRQSDIGYFYRKLISQKGFTGQMDSAKYYFREGMEFAQAQDSLEDSGLPGKLHSEMGEASHRNEEITAAQYYYTKAGEIFETVGDKLGVSIIKLNLGNIYYVQGEFDKAAELFHEGTVLADTTQYRYIRGSLFNSLAAAYEQLDDKQRSLNNTLKALEEFKLEIDTYPEYAALVYPNVAKKFKEKGEFDKALSYLDTTDRIIEKYNLEASKLNASVARAELYLVTGKERQAIELLERNKGLLDKYRSNTEDHFSYRYSLGKAYHTLNQNEKALETLLPLESLADSLNMLKEVGYINEALADIFAERGQFEKAYTARLKYESVKDSLYSVEKQTAFKEIDAKYETEKKERQLAETRANLAERELEIKQKNTLIFGSLGLAILLALLGYLFFNQQKLKNRQLQKENELKTALARIETQNKLQEQRLRISRDLHDNIGSQLTFIISSIDSLSYGLQDASTAMREKLFNISQFTSQTIYELRDTIWAMNKSNITFEDLQARIHNFIEKAGSAHSQSTFQFTVSETVPADTSFSSVQGMNIYRIIQEAVNNALKYSQAATISVKITDLSNHQLELTVRDDGAGFNRENTPLGNGIQNIEKRAKELGGSAFIESAPQQGTLVKVRFPAGQ